MKNTKNTSFKINSDYWIGSEVYALTSYGLPVRVTIDKVDVLVDNKRVGTILGYFHNNYKFSPENLMSEKMKQVGYPKVINIPTFVDYVTYEIAKAFNKQTEFVMEYDKQYVEPYKGMEKKDPTDETTNIT